MNAKHAPATPLPQGVPPDAGIYIGNLYTTPRTIADWRRKADAYPKLVAALQSIVGAYTVTDGKAGKNPAERAMIREQGRELLRELGEAA